MLQRFDIATLPFTPWKNGGGSTREIVCRPQGAGMADFDWRVSIATIAQSGPFSAFAGVDRVIMLLDGDGVQLRASSGLDHRLATPYAPLAFQGDVVLDCTLLGGTSTDFNLMTRRGALRAEVQVLRAATNLPVTGCGLLLALRGHWRLAGHGHGDSDTQDCTAGQGLWWDAAPHGWQATLHNEPNADGVTTDAAAALVWVSLDAVQG